MSPHFTMTEPTLNYVPCPDAVGGHRMAFWQWGDPQAAHLVVCVHGLSRQGRDFDTLARGLVERADGGVRVVCPDVVGRGRSDWLKDPTGYQVATYVGDMLALLAQLQRQAPIGAFDWVGTSMGGLIGLMLAAVPDLPRPSPVRRLVLNDVGPVIEWTALERIGQYVGQVGHFESVQQAADAMWAVSTGFGPHTSAQWLALSQPMVRPHPDGGFTLHYDPAIAVPLKAVTRESAQAGEAALWQLYDALTCETLLLRGALSDLLSADTALAMTRRGPKARLVVFDGVGHAPTLVADDQRDRVVSFLLGPEGRSIA